MRAVNDLYVHPDLSDSEVWDKDAHNKSGKTRVLTTVGLFSLAAMSTVAACQLTGVVNLQTLPTGLLHYTGIAL